MADASWVDRNPAFKLSISDVTKLKKTGDVWEIVFGNSSDPRLVYHFHIQVTILQVSGVSNEIMLVSDETGKAKVTRNPCIPGDFSWLKVGTCCSIIGTLLDNGNLPHINVIKLAPVENPLQQQMWPMEVEELRNFLSKRISPSLEGSMSC